MTEQIIAAQLRAGKWVVVNNLIADENRKKERR